MEIAWRVNVIGMKGNFCQYSKKGGGGGGGGWEKQKIKFYERQPYVAMNVCCLYVGLWIGLLDKWRRNIKLTEFLWHKIELYLHLLLNLSNCGN
jgi:hypothetical protein